MKKRWMLFFGFERSDDSDEEAEVNTAAVGYWIDPEEAVGEGWEQDHGPDDEPEDKRFGFHA
jgi:hypothetical protein